ncbi:hypothetical protein R3P38DRAFT_3220903 [Favolaschia claudopus]|uniref:USP domain-containing protein n=1 Tax=Favolaschia claudopus TaxID=2862362 RepID=A0AAW0A0T4_9AGAR
MPAGLLNASGTTCYINASLQALARMPGFRRLLAAHSIQCAAGMQSINLSCFACRLGALFARLDGTTVATTADEVMDYWADIRTAAGGSELRLTRQEDAQEFLLALLDRIERCVTETAFQVEFNGEVHGDLYCRDCNTAQEPPPERLVFLTIALNHNHVLEALRAWTGPEYLKDENGRRCDSAGCRGRTSKCTVLRRWIGHLPNILLLQLERFALSDSKVSRTIHYPERLELDGVLTKGQQGAAYQLHAVLCHLGNSRHSGHFVVHVQYEDGKWCTWNDNKRHALAAAPLHDPDAYLLFYSRISAHPDAPPPGVMEDVEGVVGAASGVGAAGDAMEDVEGVVGSSSVGAAGDAMEGVEGVVGAASGVGAAGDAMEDVEGVVGSSSVGAAGDAMEGVIAISTSAGAAGDAMEAMRIRDFLSLLSPSYAEAEAVPYPLWGWKELVLGGFSPRTASFGSRRWRSQNGPRLIPGLYGFAGRRTASHGAPAKPSTLSQVLRGWIVQVGDEGNDRPYNAHKHAVKYNSDSPGGV